MAKHVPNRIRYWRIERALTLKQVAVRAETTEATIQRMETSARPVTLDWLSKIAEALDVRCRDLLQGDEIQLDDHPDEVHLLDKFRRANKRDRYVLLEMAAALIR